LFLVAEARVFRLSDDIKNESEEDEVNEYCQDEGPEEQCVEVDSPRLQETPEVLLVTFRFQFRCSCFQKFEAII
jgi:hypothetical protein